MIKVFLIVSCVVLGSMNLFMGIRNRNLFNLFSAALCYFAIILLLKDLLT